MSFSGLFEWVSSDILELLTNSVAILIVCLWEMKIKPAIELFKFVGSGNTNMEGLSRVLVIYLGFCATSMHFNWIDPSLFWYEGPSKSKPKCVFNDFTAQSNKMRLRLHPEVLERLKLEFWENTMNTLKETWVNIIAYELSLKTVVYEMFLGVCFVLCHVLQKENKCRNCRVLFYRLGKRGAIQTFICCSPGKLKDYLPCLGFDLVFVSETSGMRYLNYTEDNPI